MRHDAVCWYAHSGGKLKGDIPHKQWFNQPSHSECFSVEFTVIKLWSQDLRPEFYQTKFTKRLSYACPRGRLGCSYWVDRIYTDLCDNVMTKYQLLKAKNTQAELLKAEEMGKYVWKALRERAVSTVHTLIFMKMIQEAVSIRSELKSVALLLRVHTTESLVIKPSSNRLWH